MREERAVVPNYPWLTIDREGNGYSTRTGKAYAKEVVWSGYIRYSSGYKGKSVKLSAHRAVALTFIPNDESKPTVNHINGIKTDNRMIYSGLLTPSNKTMHTP